MRLRVYPESFLSGRNRITDTNNCIICSEVLDKYKDLVLENKDGVLFKINSFNEIFCTDVSCYVNCIEFTAPSNSIIIPNTVYETLLLEYIGEFYIDLEIFIPPQASKVVFKLNNQDIFDVGNIKMYLEDALDKTYKFLELGQTIKINNFDLFVKELEPNDICFINNTDLEVEFDSPIIKENVTTPLLPDIINDIREVNEEYSENIVNTIDEPVNIAEPPRLTREELRQKRLAFYV